ncbi:MAG: cation:proton antiporter [Mycobacterium sp.]|nr:cation:proton antiporter [Mycobacterium sp.]
MHNETAFVLTVVVLCYAVISGLIRKWYVAPALIFMACGMVLGPFGLGLIDVGADAESYTILGQLALTVILFNQAAQLDLNSAFRRRHATFRLLFIGIPLTIALGAGTAVLLLPVLPLWEAVCLAAIVAPTEVALIDALLEDRRIPEQVRHALSVESGCYDGFALAALFAALALASESVVGNASAWGWFFVRTEVLSLLIGLVIGTAGGLVMSTFRRHGWMISSWAQLATVAVALVCFATAEGVHGSGFVAAFAGGLGFALVARRTGDSQPMQFSDSIGQLLEFLLFAMFGGYALIIGWRDVSWRVVGFAVVVVFVVRLIAVLVALWGTELPPRSRGFIGWFGPRGIGTLVLGLLVIEQGQIEQATLITQVVAVVVSISLVVHSVTAPLGIKLVSADRLLASREPSV